jgi:transcriptional regulator of nitric oxide reductase
MIPLFPIHTSLIGMAIRTLKIQGMFYFCFKWYSSLMVRRNWSFRKRAFVAFEISFLTFSIYIGSAIYTSSIPGLMAEFNVSLVTATLGLTLHVLGE